MKLVSWNVNGLRAAWGKGVRDYIRGTDADIVSIQETKINFVGNTSDYNMNKFDSAWSYPERKGYSGTLCFFKDAPLEIKYGMGVPEYDCEGRVITLRYRNLYIVNVYIPNSQGNLKRWYVRIAWDKAFFEYVQELKKELPVIICGDFNVAHKHIDIYPENLRNEENPAGFTSEEREGIDNLLSIGFVDSFRYLYPHVEGAYSWWSNRLYKRSENRGWRIDYILVSEDLKDKIQSVTMRSDIYGSDHCPIEMVIDLNVANNAIMQTMKGFPAKWEEYDWKKAEERLLTLQKSLTKSVFIKDRKSIFELQKKIVRSPEAKMLAVRHVSEAMSGTGMDGVRWTAGIEKLNAAMSLTSKDYHSKPMRMVVVRQKGGKERHINMPTMYDRAMQTLYAYSLDPIAEASGERKSFAFRQGRSMMDVHAYIVKALQSKDTPELLIIADVKACYASISHEWLLRNIPMDVRVLREFLKSGYVLDGEVFPPDDFGISLGANLSPILGNMVLDKMQEFIYEKLHPYGVTDFVNGNLIRFADDVLVTARTYSDSKIILSAIKEFLVVRGLELSAEKTRIIPIHNGFDFLSRHYEKINGVVITRPSDDAVKKMETNIRDFILTYTGSQENLIDKLNQKLNGWATYHKVTNATEAFRYIDVVVKVSLLQLCESKHPKWHRKKIINKYFYKEPNGEYVYALEDKTDVRVVKLGNTVLTHYAPIKTGANPYLDREYFDSRLDNRIIQNVVGKYKPVWLRQEGICYYCGKHMLTDQHKMIVPIDASKELTPRNMAYIHTKCSEGEVFFYEVDKIDREVTNGIITVLKEIHEPSEQTVIDPHVEYLREYFCGRTEARFTLKFLDIEIIMDKPLCAPAYEAEEYWYERGSTHFSQAWYSNGYTIQRVNLEKKYIVFKRDTKLGIPFKIPAGFLNEKIPPDAVAELENFFIYIKKKYGL